MKAIRSKAKWTLLLVATWLILTAGHIGSWVIGLPFIALAILLQPNSETRFFKKSPLLNMIGLVQFGYFFLLESLRGGLDVSSRVLAAKPRVDPVFYDYSMQLRVPNAQLLFITSVSLLPGTLCADLNKNRITIHTLDQHMETTQGIKRLESLVGKIFGEAL
ncbi:MAG: Na+/H+ antiporter subunit E [Arenicellales bacterium]